jgi:two-component sensor histidine kinase
MDSRRYDALLRLSRAVSNSLGMDELLQKTAELAASVLDTSLLMLLEYQPDTGTLVGRAGVGWRSDIRDLKLDAGSTTPDGHALRFGSLIISRAATEDGRFRVPRLFAVHGIARCLSIVIPGDEHAFGILKVADGESGSYQTEDIDFIQAVANTLGLAIRHRLALTEQQRLTTEYELLRGKQAVLAADAANRAKGSLELVETALNAQMQVMDYNTRPQWLQEHLDRILTISTVTEPLVEMDGMGMISIPEYMASLVVKLRADLADLSPSRQLIWEADPAFWPPRRAYALGLILLELVGACIRFGKGTVRCQFGVEKQTVTARLVVEDDGLPASIVSDMTPHAPIGLRIIWALLQRHGGGLQVDAGYPTGTRFVAVFPSAPVIAHPEGDILPVIATSADDTAWIS